MRAIKTIRELRKRVQNLADYQRFGKIWILDIYRRTSPNDRQSVQYRQLQHTAGATGNAGPS